MSTEAQLYTAKEDAKERLTAVLTEYVNAATGLGLSIDAIASEIQDIAVECDLPLTVIPES